MTDEVTRVEALCREIFDNVLQAIRRDFGETPPSLHAVAAQTRKRHDEAAERLRTDYHSTDEREERRLVSQARYRAHKDALEKREALLDSLLDAGYHKALEQWEASPAAYAEVLAIEGARELDGSALTVRLPAAAAGKLPGDFCRRVEETLLTSFGREVKVTLGEDTEEAALPGVVVAVDGTSVLYDNSLTDRLRRGREGLRGEVAAMLAEEVGHEREEL